MILRHRSTGKIDESCLSSEGEELVKRLNFQMLQLTFALAIQFNLQNIITVIIDDLKETGIIIIVSVFLIAIGSK